MNKTNEENYSNISIFLSLILEDYKDKNGGLIPSLYLWEDLILDYIQYQKFDDIQNSEFNLLLENIRNANSLENFLFKV